MSIERIGSMATATAGKDCEYSSAEPWVLTKSKFMACWIFPISPSIVFVSAAQAAARLCICSRSSVSSIRTGRCSRSATKPSLEAISSFLEPVCFCSCPILSERSLVLDFNTSDTSRNFASDAWTLCCRFSTFMSSASAWLESFSSVLLMSTRLSSRRCDITRVFSAFNASLLRISSKIGVKSNLLKSTYPQRAQSTTVSILASKLASFSFPVRSLCSNMPATSFRSAVAL
mmetsp:Transcript_46061/g.107656  ORF Transcript_46061/g.107656 Transcript_46061/m.107656 type:complete len:231 (+) Transcript_46061:1906-2598(+)